MLLMSFDKGNYDNIHAEESSFLNEAGHDVGVQGS